MIDRTAFLADAQKIVARLEKDLRARCDAMPEVGTAVEAEYRKAKDAGRTGQTLEEWRADAITQQERPSANVVESRVSAMLVSTCHL